MIQTRPYEFMVSYTPQTQWIEKGGIKLWLAFFFIELGAGMFFVASIFGNLPAMWIGWLLCAVLGGGLHMLYLGKPLRFWRMLLSSGWKTSWISRGLFFVTLFLILGLIHMALLQMEIRFTPLLAAADAFAFLAVIYGGFAMNYVNGIPLWNTALLPILYVVSGLWGGAEVTLGIVAGSGDRYGNRTMDSHIADRLHISYSRIPAEREVHVRGRPGLGALHGREQMGAFILDRSDCGGHGDTVDCGDQQPFGRAGGDPHGSDLRRHLFRINRRSRHALPGAEVRHVCSPHPIFCLTRKMRHGKTEQYGERADLRSEVIARL